MCCSMIYGRSFGRDEWRRGGKTTETPFPTTEISEGCAQMFGAEIRPQGFDEVELRVGRFPQQKVRQALFAAGADEQVDIAASLRLRRSEETAESLARGRMICPPAGGCIRNRIARGIIESNLQIEPRFRGQCPFHFSDLVAQTMRQPVATTNDGEVCPALDQPRQLSTQILS